jgi:hypothetical protein
MSPHLVTIHETWNLSFQKEMIVEIQHSLNGLIPGTVLKSQEAKHRWKVVNRICFLQAKNQKRFNGEHEKYLHFSFHSPAGENTDKFQRDMETKESNGIYQYTIEPLGHDAKPRLGEVLAIE